MRCLFRTCTQVSKTRELAKKRLELGKALVRASEKAANPKAAAKAKLKAAPNTA